MPRVKKTQIEDNAVSISQLKEQLKSGNANIRSAISFMDTKKLCERIVDFCFDKDEENNITEFNPCGKELVMREYILLYYVDVKYESTEELENFCYSEYFDMLLNHISTFQYNNITKTIDELIEFRKQKLLNENLDYVVSKIRNIVDKISDLIDGFDVDGFKELLPLLNTLNQNADQQEIPNKIVDITTKKPPRKKQSKITVSP